MRVHTPPIGHAIPRHIRVERPKPKPMPWGEIRRRGFTLLPLVLAAITTLVTLAFLFSQ